MRARFQQLVLAAIWMFAASVAVAAAEAGTAGHPARTASPPTTHAAPLERPATRLLGVSVEGSDVGTRIRLLMDGAPRSVGAFVLDDPQRLVIDLFDLRDTNTPAHLSVGSLQTSRIRVGRHVDKVRVVIDAGSAPSAFARVGQEIRPDGFVVTVGAVDDRTASEPAAEIEAPVDASVRSALAPGDPPALAALAPALVLRRSVPSRDTHESPSGAATPTPTRHLEPGAARSAGDIRLELQAERTRLDPALPRAVRVSRTWKDTLELDSGGGALAGGEGLRVATPYDWERAALAVNRIRLDLLEDRVRLTTRYGRSDIGTPESYLAARGGAAPERDWDRLLSPRADIGQAFSQRLDASLWNPGFTRVGAFGSYRRVDPRFEWKDADKRDPFGRSGRSALEVGGTIGAGAFGVTLSRISEEAEIDAFRVDDRRSTRAVLTASLDPLWHLGDGAWLDSGLARFAPSSAWLSMDRGDVDHGDSRASAATSDLSFGTSWVGEASSAALSFWRSRYTSIEMDLDWSGSGADFSYGIDREQWGLYAGLGAQRYRSDQADDTSSESSVAGYVSFLV